MPARRTTASIALSLYDWACRHYRLQKILVPRLVLQRDFIVLRDFAFTAVRALTV